MFYDMSATPVKTDVTPPSHTQYSPKGHVLLTTVSGVAIDKYSSMTESEVVQSCLRTLRAMFPGVDVPEPDSYILTHWGRDPNALMSYSYVATGSNGEDYDALSKDEDGRLFFAGEVRDMEGWHESSARFACTWGVHLMLHAPNTCLLGC